MSVDAIVLDIDGGAMLDACIASIHAQSVPARVIVFDNGSSTPIRRTDTVVLRSETNLGFTGGVNEAFRHTSAEFIALVNNDVVLDPDWLETVLTAMADPRVGAVQTALGSPRNAAEGGDAPLRLDGAGIDISDGTYRQIRTLNTPAWGVSATAALYRRSAVGTNIFDPRFFAYYEDVELCARLHAAGWTTRVIPEIKATHRGSQSAGVLGRRAKYLRTRNRYFVARLHPGVGRIGALLWEDARLLARGRSSLRGIIEGLCSTL